jgi:hypothetical protein
MDNKTMVLGAIQRGGDVRLRVEKRPTKPTLRKFIRETTVEGPKTIYKNVVGAQATHESVNHSREEWVRGNVHTNTIENAFSLFKRSIVGSYHHLSAKHLDAYLDEFEFRFNRRNRADLFADTIRHLVGAKTLTFKALTVTERR